MNSAITKTQEVRKQRKRASSDCWCLWTAV